MLAAGFAEYLKLKRSQWWEGEALLDLQWRRTIELIEQAYAHVPFYRNRFIRAGIEPGDISRFSDLSRIPPCTKDELRPAYDNGSWHADNFNLSECAGAVTSGSTGRPLKFHIDKRSLAFRFAMNLRTLEFSDYRLGQKLFQVSPPLSGKLGDGIKTRLLDMVLRRVTVPPFELDIDNKLELLVDFRPSAIVGYTSYIKSLADKAAHLPSPPRIKSIMTTSEKLTLQTRRKLSATFGGRVFDQYGSVESGRSAAECGRSEGYHINTEGVLIEIVDKDGRHLPPGESGEVLITNLMNYVNPFIRYKIGDIATLADEKGCPCGRSSPRLEKIGGRLNDVIVTPGGRSVMPEYFYLTLREIKGLAQFQIVQDDPASLIVRYGAEDDFDEAKRLEIEEEYRDYMSDMKVVWERVEKFNAIAGKHKHIIAFSRSDKDRALDP